MAKIIFDELELRKAVAQANGWVLQRTPKGQRLKDEVYELLSGLGNF